MSFRNIQPRFEPGRSPKTLSFHHSDSYGLETHTLWWSLPARRPPFFLSMANEIKSFRNYVRSGDSRSSNGIPSSKSFPPHL